MGNVVQFPSSLDRANRALCQAFERFNASDDASADHFTALTAIMHCAVNGPEVEVRSRASTWLLEAMNIGISAQP